MATTDTLSNKYKENIAENRIMLTRECDSESDKQTDAVTGSPSQYIFPIGHYRGKTIAECPLKYLQCILECPFTNNHSRTAEHEFILNNFPEAIAKTKQFLKNKVQSYRELLVSQHS